MKEPVFQNMMKAVAEEQKHDDARAQVKIREMTNRLMGDMVKKYDNELKDEMFLD